MVVPAVTTYSMMLRLQLITSEEFVTAFPESLVRNCATMASIDAAAATNRGTG